MAGILVPFSNEMDYWCKRTG
jgi:hypothetical protein